MPRIPNPADLNIGQSVQNIPDQTPFQNISASPDAFGAQRGREFQKLGNNISGAGQNVAKIKEEQDKADSYNAMNGAEADIRESHYDPEKGIYNRKGAQALTAYEDSRKAVDDIYAKRSQNLSPQAQFRFQQMWGQKRESILNGSARFEAQQRNSYKNDSSNALINNSINDAVENYNNPQAVTDNAAIIQYTLEDSIGELPKDATPEQTKRRNAILEEKSGQAMDKLHTGVISKYAANGRTDIAKAYYKNVKSDISGLNQIKLDSMMKQGDLRGKSQQEFDKISNSGKDEASQLQAARNIKDPELRDSVEARVKSSWNDPKTRQQETAELIKSESWQQIVEGKSPEQIPLEMWASLDPATQKKMEKFSVEGAPKNSNHISYLELKNKMATDEDDFQKTNLFDYATELSSRDFKYFDDRQKELMKDDRSGLVKNRTNLRIVSDRLGAVGIKKSKYGGGKNDKKIAIFNRALDEKLETFALENNRAARENEVESIIDSMLIKGEVDETELGTGRFGTDEKFAFEGNFNSFTVDEVSNIPSQLKRAAENSLRKRNILVNDENIISMVNKHLERQNAK